MPTNAGSSAAKNASSFDRRSDLRTSTVPAASKPCTWKTCLARSNPIVATGTLEALRSMRDHGRTLRPSASGARAVQSIKRGQLQGAHKRSFPSKAIAGLP